MVDPSQLGITTVPEEFSADGFLSPAKKHHNTAAMPIIGGHIPSFLGGSASSAKKIDSRTAFSPYTGSLTKPSKDTRQGIVEELGTSLSIGTISSITLHVRYVARDMWRKVTFPPGITVTQARDICMLRFNIWQQTIIQESGSGRTSSEGTRGAPAGLDGMPRTQTQTSFREQYGLFWTSAGHWLEADQMLGTYALRKNEVLELQNVVDFVPLTADEFKLSYIEGHIYYLQSDSAGTSWQRRWTVLRNRVLRVYRKKGQTDADITVDLCAPCRLIDQNKHVVPRISSKTPGASQEMQNVGMIIDALSDTHIDGDGGFLVIQTFNSQSQSGAKNLYSFRTCNAYDYECWRNAFRHTLSGATAGVGSGCSTSASLSATSNNSRGAQPSDASNNATSSTLELGSVRLHESAIDNEVPRLPTTRHEGFVQRKSPHGYGFRRRYCILRHQMLYGFLSEPTCDDDDDKLLEAAEFAVSLSPESAAIEAIAWNGRYLLRVFALEGALLRDIPPPTSLSPASDARTHCTDILATAAQSAIEQHGSTFGIPPQSTELVRIMIDDHDAGQRWALAFNSVAGIQVLGHSRVIARARKAHSPKRQQQSLSEFIVSQMNAVSYQDAHDKPCTSPPESPEAGDGKAPRWVPLSIDKYVREEEERQRSHGPLAYESAVDLSHAYHGGSPGTLKTKTSNVSGSDSSTAKAPTRFNWFKRRGSTSR